MESASLDKQFTIPFSMTLLLDSLT